MPNVSCYIACLHQICIILPFLSSRSACTWRVLMAEAWVPGEFWHCPGQLAAESKGSKALNAELQGPNSLSRRTDAVDYFISIVGQISLPQFGSCFHSFQPAWFSNVTNPLKIPHDNHSYSIPFSHFFPSQHTYHFWKDKLIKLVPRTVLVM